MHIAKVIPAKASISNSGDTLIASKGFKYQWYRDSVLIKGANTESYLPDSNGNYFVSIADSNVCTSMSAPLKYNGIDQDRQLLSHLNCYPDPFWEKLTVSIDLETSSQVEINLYDLTGKLVFHREQARLSAGRYNFNIASSQLNNIAGIYILKMLVGDKMITKRVVAL